MEVVEVKNTSPFEAPAARKPGFRVLDRGPAQQVNFFSSFNNIFALYL